MEFVYTVKLKDHNFYILRSLKSVNWQILNFVYSSLGNMDFFYYKCQISKYLILRFAKSGNWQMSKFLYSALGKIWIFSLL